MSQLNQFISFIFKKHLRFSGSRPTRLRLLFFFALFFFQRIKTESLLMMTDNEGNTPLHDAVRNKHEKVVRMLVKTFNSNLQRMLQASKQA
ncbi:hypothetical protein WN944_002094 [Citrus x changshan-huyou]|uniref:Ankyrin repeat protein n=1 Tax=Citrus x changshan-huyou TaxID=2935761 RepID=A0AAP0QRV5_9ROSI